MKDNIDNILTKEQQDALRILLKPTNTRTEAKTLIDSMIYSQNI